MILGVSIPIPRLSYLGILPADDGLIHAGLFDKGRHDNLRVKYWVGSGA